MTINDEQLMQARFAWGNGIIAISKAYEESDITEAKIIARVTSAEFRGLDTISEIVPIIFPIIKDEEE